MRTHCAPWRRRGWTSSPSARSRTPSGRWTLGWTSNRNRDRNREPLVAQRSSRQDAVDFDHDFDFDFDSKLIHSLHLRPLTIPLAALDGGFDEGHAGGAVEHVRMRVGFAGVLAVP